MEVFHLGSFFNLIRNSILIFIFLIIFICIFFVPFISSANLSKDFLDGQEIILNPNGFIWPSPRIYKNKLSLW